VNRQLAVPRVGECPATVALAVAACADLAPPALTVWVGGAVGSARKLILTPHRWPARRPGTLSRKASEIDRPMDGGGTGEIWTQIEVAVAS